MCDNNGDNNANDLPSTPPQIADIAEKAVRTSSSSERQPIKEFEKNEIAISNEFLQGTASHAQIQDTITVPPTPSTRPLHQLQDQCRCALFI
ncbi:unnamed protein product [Tenebrio molitor]|nr:unnamed protein product [Tenebrio molitor]